MAGVTIIEETTTTTTTEETELTEAEQKKELLADVNNAIRSVMVGGQSYKIGSRSLTRADLYTLEKMRESLMAEINADNGNTGLLDDCYVGVFDGR